VLTSNHQHHYVAPGFINNQPVIFMLDTGASDVVIPQPLARRLGLKARGSSLAQTANGVITVHGTLLDSLQLGPITLHNVRASINPAMRDQEILLGMSALRQLEFSQRDGQLTIRQHGP
jgi:aspartyl protease family protein